MVFNDDSLIKSIHCNSDCQSSTVTADISIQSVTKEGLKMTITLFLMIISGAIHHKKQNTKKHRHTSISMVGVREGRWFEILWGVQYSEKLEKLC